MISSRAKLMTNLACERYETDNVLFPPESPCPGSVDTSVFNQFVEDLKCQSFDNDTSSLLLQQQDCICSGPVEVEIWSAADTSSTPRENCSKVSLNYVFEGTAQAEICETTTVSEGCVPIKSALEGNAIHVQEDGQHLQEEDKYQTDVLETTAFSEASILEGSVPEGNTFLIQEDITMIEADELERVPKARRRLEFSCEDQEIPCEGSRKRSRRPEEWIRNKAKRGCNTGIEHLNQKGKLIPARQMREGCENCRFCCPERVSKEEREAFFKEFWELGDRKAQWDFMNRFAKSREPATHTKIVGANNRSVTRKYFISGSGGKEIHVCRTMFLNTLCISERSLTTAHNKTLRRNGCTTSPDWRGKNQKINQERVNRIISFIDVHIKMFDVMPSHFCRKRIKRQYLEPGLSINKMYEMYVKWMNEQHSDEEVASSRRYRDRFCSAYNYGFFLPKKDQCEFCNVYSRLNANLRGKMKEKYETHFAHKVLSRDKKKFDKRAAETDPKKCFAIFDLQKVLTTPKDETSILYYKRKLSTYNFTVFNGGKRKGKCYVWHEGEGKRGANEVASCLEEFIRQHVEENPNTTEFLFWSDNCYGQNKNKFLYSQFVRLSQKYHVKISIKYLETGHTQNECDSVHARIESAARNKPVFTSEQWYDIIAGAKVNGQSYDVIRMEGNFVDLHDFCDKYFKFSGHRGINWKEVREVVFDTVDPAGTIHVRDSLKDDVPLKAINVMKSPSRGRPINLKTFTPQPAYTGPLRINAKKLKDLFDLCKTNVIPENHRPFFENLPNFPKGPMAEPVKDQADPETDEKQWSLEGNDEPDFDYLRWQKEQMEKTGAVESADNDGGGNEEEKDEEGEFQIGSEDDRSDDE